MSGGLDLDIVNYIKTIKIEVKSLSTRFKYLTRHVIQQKRQLDSAVRKIASLEMSFNQSKDICHSSKSKHSVGCQFSQKSKLCITASPNISSDSESFESFNKHLEVSNTRNTQKRRKSEIQSSSVTYTSPQRSLLL
ncbi:unnamed protein product [Heterobilharzia americana]|nr:unnamed protein product [Heterobilharzia americana]